MVTDSRGHEVPAGSDSWGYREDMGLLSASISDVRQVADTAAATSAVADLDAAGITSVGTVWWLDSPGGLYVYDGTTFAQLPTAGLVADAIPTVAYGTTSVTGKAVDTRRKTITYPAGRFAGVPIVMLQNLTGFNVGGSMNQSEWVSDRTSTSMQINVSRGNTTAVTMSWLAVLSPARTGFDPALSTMLDDDVDTDVVLVQCERDGCPNKGASIEIPATTTGEDGVQHRQDDVECGVCGADITATAREAS